jgi:DNA-directed RNA polymerase subunit RPC12/RpoP
MKCGNCGKKMKIVREEIFGEKVNVWECPCGEKLVELDEAIRL